MAQPAEVFGGVSILTVTPLDSDGRLCERDFQSLMEFVTTPRLDGETVRSLTVCGEMGEGFCLTREDKSRVIAAAKEFLGPKRAVIAAVFALSQRDAIEQAELCRASGADALLVAPVAPFLYGAKALQTFFSGVGAAAGLPVIAYLNKMFKQALPSPEIVRAVYELPAVAGIKDSTGDLAFIAQLVEQRPAGKLVIHTVSSNALAGVRAGADGLMVGTSNLVPEAALELWVRGRKDDAASLEAARSAQERLGQAAALYKIANDPGTSSKDWVIVKEALAQWGVIDERAKFPAPPYEALGEDDRRKVQEQLARLGARGIAVKSEKSPVSYA